jgi:hypothetical protein
VEDAGPREILKIINLTAKITTAKKGIKTGQKFVRPGNFTASEVYLHWGPSTEIHHPHATG